MKLIFAVVNNDDFSFLTEELKTQGIYFTKIASTGGFLVKGNVTLMIGIPDDLLEKTLSIIDKTCKKRSSKVPITSTSIEMGMPMLMNTIDVEIGGATVFVLNSEEFHKY